MKFSYGTVVRVNTGYFAGKFGFVDDEDVDGAIVYLDGASQWLGEEYEVIAEEELEEAPAPKAKLFHEMLRAREALYGR